MPSQNTIKCSKCGTEKGTTNVRLKKLVAKYGSKKKLEAQYVCRSCKGGNTPAVGKTSTKKSKKLPTSKVICSKCNGKFGTTKVRMEKLISQYGSLEGVHANYVCRKCRKEHNVDKRGRAKPVKRKRKKNPVSTWPRDEKGEIILPKWMSNFTPRPRHRCTAEELAKVNVCWRPDIWSDNALKYKKKCCNGCPSHERGSCGCKNKVFVKEKVAKVAKKKKTKKKKK